MTYARLMPVIAEQAHIAQWFCEQHPQVHLIFTRNRGRGRVRCVACEREAISCRSPRGLVRKT